MPKGVGVRVPPLAHNISDLTPKIMHTNAYEWFECIRNAYKNGENMENYEGWDPHPSRKNIYINQKTRLLYRRTKVGSFRRISQKMTESQELESFRRMDGIVAMTSRSRGRTPPPSDKTLTEES